MRGSDEERAIGWPSSFSEERGACGRRGVYAAGRHAWSGAAQQSSAPPAPAVARPTRTDAEETVVPPMPVSKSPHSGRYGADAMVDVIKSLDIDYIAINPANTFRALHESLLNYGGNRMPEVLTALHEEQAVAMAQGYYKIEGKPMAVACHGTVGLMHATMALYNAYCDRVPLYLVHRLSVQPGQTVLSAQNPAALVRDFTKWNDGPRIWTQFAESVVRAYKSP